MLGLIDQGSKEGEDRLEYWLNGKLSRSGTWSGVDNDPQVLTGAVSQAQADGGARVEPKVKKW